MRQLTENHRLAVIGAGHKDRPDHGEIHFHKSKTCEVIYAAISGPLKLVRYSKKGWGYLIHLVTPVSTFAETGCSGSTPFG